MRASRAAQRPIRLLLNDGAAGAAPETGARRGNQPFRFGYGEHCELRLDGGDGPEVMFEIQRSDGPLLLATRVPATEFSNYLELKVDGKPLNQPVQALQAGSRLDIVDKGTERRYSVVVEPPRRWYVRPRLLAVAGLVLAAASAGYGGYIYRSLQGTQQALSRTTERVSEAEADAQRTEARLLETVARVERSENEFRQLIEELRNLQGRSEQQIRAEFDVRLEAINERSREDMEKLATIDDEGRRELAERTREDLDRLRGEFADRMVASYQELKTLEQRLLDSVVARIGEIKPRNEHFKQMLAVARTAVLFIHVSYEVEFTRTGETRPAASAGTGFIVDADGLAITAQHVLYPWRNDRNLLVLTHLGLARVVPDSMRWSAWRAGSRVLLDPSDRDSLDEQSGHYSWTEPVTLDIVYAPAAETKRELIQSPIGAVEVPVPIPGATDSAVIRIAGDGRPWPALELQSGMQALEALDEVMVLGYPFSRLPDGIAEPQGVRGFVRSVTSSLVELDAPLHPGVSGGPVLDSDGMLAGLVMATLSSDVYGIALGAPQLQDLLDQAQGQQAGGERPFSEANSGDKL